MSEIQNDLNPLSNDLGSHQKLDDENDSNFAIIGGFLRKLWINRSFFVFVNLITFLVGLFMFIYSTASGKTSLNLSANDIFPEDYDVCAPEMIVYNAQDYTVRYMVISMFLLTFSLFMLFMFIDYFNVNFNSTCWTGPVINFNKVSNEDIDRFGLKQTDKNRNFRVTDKSRSKPLTVYTTHTLFFVEIFLLAFMGGILLDLTTATSHEDLLTNIFDITKNDIILGCSITLMILSIIHLFLHAFSLPCLNDMQSMGGLTGFSALGGVGAGIGGLGALLSILGIAGAGAAAATASLPLIATYYMRRLIVSVFYLIFAVLSTFAAHYIYSQGIAFQRRDQSALNIERNEEIQAAIDKINIDNEQRKELAESDECVEYIEKTFIMKRNLFYLSAAVVCATASPMYMLFIAYLIRTRHLTSCTSYSFWYWPFLMSFLLCLICGAAASVCLYVYDHDDVNNLMAHDAMFGCFSTIATINYILFLYFPMGQCGVRTNAKNGISNETINLLLMMNTQSAYPNRIR